MTHVNFAEDRCRPEFVTYRGIRIFIDMPEAIAHAYARRAWETKLARMELKPEEGDEPYEPPTPEDKAKFIEAIFKDTYQEGQSPWVATV